ncbi:MAG: tyrosine-type recombinase/integrase [Ginsengibacter sp.]
MNAINPKFESPLPHHMKPLPVAGFINLNKTSARVVPNIYNYRKPSLVKGKKAWYIEYSYRIPVDVRYLYNDREWYRFRIKEDINKRKGKEKEEYAQWLLGEITQSLRRGYNPFEKEIAHVENEADGITLPEELDAKDALQLFLDKWSQRGLAKESFSKYVRYVGRLMRWLKSKGMLYGDVRKITVDHIEAFLEQNKNAHKLSNREYNNTYDFIRTAFNFLLKKKLIYESPCAGIDKLKAKSSKHRFFDDENLKTITKALLNTDPYTYMAFQTVYYLCVRSDKELMNLKVGNIYWKENKIYADAEGTKGSAGRWIPMDENIKRIFLEKKINEYPPEYFVFGIKGNPSEKPFGSGFFSKRFRKIRNKAGLPGWFTMYGMKHTRVIHLKMDGLADQDIMSLTGHKDFGAYAKYLRDLGLAADPAKINKLSRVI